ncbi:hypothetical protein GW17_00002679 [Ensete ventricosum]|nr:hypothetical protein GW17_00002679 [Ensete ventricosum]
MEPGFAILTYTVRYGRYIPVRQVTGTRTACYWAVLPKIDRRRPIEGKIDRQRSIEEEKGKKKRKRRKKKRRIKNTAPSSPACRHRPWVARALSPPAGAFSPARGERSRRHRYADRPLPDDTIDLGCLCPVASRNWLEEEGQEEEPGDPAPLSLDDPDPSPPSFAKMSPPSCLRRRGDDFSFAHGEEASATSSRLCGESFFSLRGEKKRVDVAIFFFNF